MGASGLRLRSTAHFPVHSLPSGLHQVFWSTARLPVYTGPQPAFRSTVLLPVYSPPSGLQPASLPTARLLVQPAVCHCVPKPCFACTGFAFCIIAGIPVSLVHGLHLARAGRPGTLACSLFIMLRALFRNPLPTNRLRVVGGSLRLESATVWGLACAKYCGACDALRAADSLG
jgi:hypothetical protein